ncbi:MULTISPECIES: metal-dependent transcriptional regulator [Caproicibacterium]|uniref:Metal-dependent transcriptional regulator n=1 Tax=Caproicibacterium argilliputei TaxID=3030016 RepID=A0AA97D885_9FIRM|nr:metal-dependent transcriptional regulator [Caproicibacterium argilliputei]WOC31494.1 metal-dependent transcriptional regulator [Caproicibacterium argilliputei]
MQIHESAEDYLESILMLKEKQGVVRSIDIVNKTGYSKPSISVAMKHLRENGYITMDKEGFISLTASGMAIASEIYTRHRVLTKLLVSLGVDEKTAAEDACRVEHDLSEVSFEKIKEHAKLHLSQTSEESGTH